MFSRCSSSHLKCVEAYRYEVLFKTVQVDVNTSGETLANDSKANKHTIYQHRCTGSIFKMRPVQTTATQLCEAAHGRVAAVCLRRRDKVLVMGRQLHLQRIRVVVTEHDLTCLTAQHVN